MKRVSIYLSSYNHAKYLRESIDSLLYQTFTDFELIIEDDASTDESWFIIKSYTDPRIRAFRNSNNRNDFEGMRKVIFEMATGEYIAIHHSDDIWEPEKLQKQVDFLDAYPQFGAVFTNALIIDENGKRFKDKSHAYYRIFKQPNRSRYEWLNFFFYTGNALCHPSLLIRKTCYDECGFYRNGLNQLGDFDMWVRLCLKYEIHVIPEKLVRFRVRANEMNTSGNRPEMRIRLQFEFLQVLDNYLKIPTYHELVKIFPAAQKYYRQDGCDIGYVLGLIALETKNDNPIYSLYGLKLLFEAINDPDRASRINELYGFSQKDFIELTAKNDIFSIELKPYLYSQLAEKEQVIQSLSAQVTEKDQTLQALSAQAAEKDQALQALSAQAAEKDQALQALQVQLEEREQQAITLKAQLAEGEQHQAVLQVILTEHEQQVKVLTDQLAEQEQQVSVINSQKTSLQRELTGLKDHLNQREQILQDLNAKLLEIYSSTAWKIIQVMWKVRLWLAPKGSQREHIARLVSHGLSIRKRDGSLELPNKLPQKEHFQDDYEEWIWANEPGLEELKQQRQTVKSFAYQPLISIIVPVFNITSPILKEMIESVLSQTYDNWELCIANGSPNSMDICKILRNYSKKDQRIKIIQLEKNLGITGNTNAALKLAAGDFVGFLDHDDLLAPFALFEVAKTIIENPTIDLIYSDEDKITADDHDRYEPFFKPAFSPDFIRSINYMPHFLIIRRKTGDEIGWLRDGFEGAQDYDLILRTAERAKQIAHIPKILYHWRACPGSTAKAINAKDYATESGIKAVKDHLQRMGLNGSVSQAVVPTTYRVTYNLADSPMISIIIPNKDNNEELQRCVASILEKSSYKNFEILILENNSQEAATFSVYKELQKSQKVQVIEYTQQPFNFSSINNFGAHHANGSILLFMNNDMEVINSDWLEHMLEYVIRPEVGVVGAKLYYLDDTIQHGGVIIGIRGIAGHAHKYAPRTSSGYFNRLMLLQNLSAVTAACLMIRRKVFEGIGGFDSNFRLAFGDIDFCMKVRENGYLVVWTPYSELYHYESLTRGFEDTEEKRNRFANEVALFRQKWSAALERGDDYYNPNLTLSTENFGINPNPVNVSVRIKPGFMNDQDGHKTGPMRE